MPRAASAVEAGSQDQDRVAVLHIAGAVVLVLSDGAGGRSGGREAAEGVVRLVRNQARRLAADSVDAVAVLTEVDQALAQDQEAGEATAVLAVVVGSQVSGASAGDSGAWLVGRDDVLDLTQGQVRKPMIGSGSAVVLPFGPVNLGDRRLLMASDGLLKYSPREKIQARTLSAPIDKAVLALIDSVRYASGALPDDVSVILCER